MTRRHARTLSWCLAALAFTLVSGGLAAWKHRNNTAPRREGPVPGLSDALARAIPADYPARVAFTDVTQRAGIRFRHFNGDRASLIAEDMGSGAGWADYDLDGDLDLFIANAAGSILLPAQELARSPARCALYRNRGDGSFEDVAHQAGVDAALTGMGVAWGDYDNDGDLDLYVTAYGPNRLLRNDGGRFLDVSREAGVDDDRFGAGAAWGDYDLDGDLDLYVANYVQFSFSETDRQRPAAAFRGDLPYTLNPSSYPPERNLLYRNNGDGTFSEVAKEAGCADPNGRGMSVSWVDFDGDLWPDLYIANDVSQNGVFRNRGDGSFEDVGASSLAADYRGAMGLAVGDPDNDGDFDLFLTHWIAQENALYENQRRSTDPNAPEGPALFMDMADARGLGQISLDAIGWGTEFIDFDNDGRLDLFVVNGSTFERPEDTRLLVPMLPFLFWNHGPAGFYEVGKISGDFFQRTIVGRGAAFGDYDNDGDVDAFVVVHGGPGILLRNDGGNASHWLKVRLGQTHRNRFAVGASVRLLAGGAWQTRQVGAGNSYLSHNSLELEFGLGQNPKADRIEIRWPDGHQQALQDISANQTIEIQREGEE
ncbi:MAG: CRTAC1 family protein [Planctomycetes bacterium]|nr:CRTAC1 family protein [Planctomycetota bacterium]